MHSNIYCMEELFNMLWMCFPEYKYVIRGGNIKNIWMKWLIRRNVFSKRGHVCIDALNV